MKWWDYAALFIKIFRRLPISKILKLRSCSQYPCDESNVLRQDQSLMLAVKYSNFFRNWCKLLVIRLPIMSVNRREFYIKQEQSLQTFKHGSFYSHTFTIFFDSQSLKPIACRIIYSANTRFSSQITLISYRTNSY